MIYETVSGDKKEKGFGDVGWSQFLGLTRESPAPKFVLPLIEDSSTSKEKTEPATTSPNHWMTHSKTKLMKAVNPPNPTKKVLLIELLADLKVQSTQKKTCLSKLIYKKC